MDPQIIRVALPAVLLLHGLGHGGAIAALAWIAARPGGPTGDWHAARSWALPGLAPGTATAVACAFWALALVGFVAAALALAGVAVPGMPCGRWPWPRRSSRSSGSASSSGRGLRSTPWQRSQ